ncbi:MAG: exopolyphosphatase [bacterium]|nr:exopolyphosphatase [bacterium]
MRLVTRADLDGLACALIMTRHDEVDEIVLVHPQEITDKTFDVLEGDCIANLPYHPACSRWFDHHLLTASNEKPPPKFDGLHRVAPSAAQLVWEYYGQDSELTDLVHETNRFDSAQLTEDDVLQPRGYVLLGFTLDPRTGLGDNEAYFMKCLEWLKSKPVREVLLQEEVRQRIIRMFEQNEDFCWTLVQYSRLNDNVVFTDFRRVAEPPAGNRFLVYTLFPEANVSVRAQWGGNKEHVMVNVGHSIFDRSCKVSIGDLMSDYGGGGHRGAGSTPLPVMEADAKIVEIIDKLRRTR